MLGFTECTGDMMLKEEELVEEHYDTQSPESTLGYQVSMFCVQILQAGVCLTKHS